LCLRQMHNIPFIRYFKCHRATATIIPLKPGTARSNETFPPHANCPVCLAHVIPQGRPGLCSLCFSHLEGIQYNHPENAAHFDPISAILIIFQFPARFWLGRVDNPKGMASCSVIYLATLTGYMLRLASGTRSRLQCQSQITTTEQSRNDNP
jgi:hypothetical protein